MNETWTTIFGLVFFVLFMIVAFKIGVASVDNNEMELMSTQIELEHCQLDMNDTIINYERDITYNSIENSLDIIKSDTECISMLLDKDNMIDNLTQQLND